MDDLLKTLEELDSLLKKQPQFNPSIKQPTMGSGMGITMPKPASPKIPGIEQSSKKDPVKVAQQLKNPKAKELKIKELLKFAANGQWSLEKASNNVKANTRNLDQDAVNDRHEQLANKLGIDLNRPNPYQNKDLFVEGDPSHEMAHTMLVPPGHDVHDYLTNHLPNPAKVSQKDSNLHEMAAYHLAAKLGRMAGVSPHDADDISMRRRAFDSSAHDKQEPVNVQYHKGKPQLNGEKLEMWNSAKNMADEALHNWTTGKHKHIDGRIVATSPKSIEKADQPLAPKAPKYHILTGGQRITDEPMSLHEINHRFGGVKRLEAAGHKLVPHDKPKTEEKL